MKRSSNELDQKPTYFALPLHDKKKPSSVFDKREKHDKLMEVYNNKLKRTPVVQTTELDILKQNHKFLRNDEDNASLSWEDRVAKKYYDKLFKEYTLCDLSRYKTGKIAMRWRTAKEVTTAKGHLSCGNIKCNESGDSLKTWEVNFGYVEHGEKLNALVKLRLCPGCSDMLNYSKKFKQVPADNPSTLDTERNSKRRLENNERVRKEETDNDKDVQEFLADLFQ